MIFLGVRGTGQSPHARAVRGATVLLAAIQLLLGPALAIADAAAQARSTTRVAIHLEEHSTANCRPPHDDRCVICQQLTTPVVRSVPPAIVAVAAAVEPAVTREREARVLAGAHLLPPPRGPPVRA